MATRLKKTDVVIIGLGAAGGTAALPLARAGLQIVGLEAGPRVSFRDFPSDEIRKKLHAYPALSDGDERTMKEAMAQVTGA